MTVLRVPNSLDCLIPTEFATGSRPRQLHTKGFLCRTSVSCPYTPVSREPGQNRKTAHPPLGKKWHNIAQPSGESSQRIFGEIYVLFKIALNSNQPTLCPNSKIGDRNSNDVSKERVSPVSEDAKTFAVKNA